MMNKTRILLTVLLLCAPAPAFAQDGSGPQALYRRLEEARAAQIERLHVYAVEGRFPQNAEFPGQRVPFFVDRRGTRCAVGELMWRAGRQDAVRRIAAADNHVRIMDVTEGPFLDWVVGSGLTQEECAAVQPSYEFYFHAAEKERKRIQKHLLAVEARLRQQTAASLGVALRRALDREIDLGKLTKANAKALWTALGDPEPNVRIGAVHALSRLRIPSRKRLTALLKDAHREVRFWAAAALIEALPTPTDPGPYHVLLNTLRDCLKHGAVDARMLAIGRIGVLAAGARTLPGDRKILVDIRAALAPHRTDKAKDVAHLARFMTAVASLEKRSMEALAHFNVGRMFLAVQAGDEVHAAALHLDKTWLVSLLEKRPELVRHRNQFGETPLHLAARSSWTQADVLVKAGAPLDAVSAAGRIPLHGARWLLVEGDVHARDTHYRWTPLHYAAQNVDANEVRRLIAGGADPDARDRYGFTALHIAVGCQTPEREPATFSAGVNGWLVVRKLLEGGADPSIADARGRTPVDLALRLGRKDCLEELDKAKKKRP